MDAYTLLTKAGFELKMIEKMLRKHRELELVVEYMDDSVSKALVSSIEELADTLSLLLSSQPVRRVYLEPAS